LNYPEDKLVQTYKNHKKVTLGTEYHGLASRLIKLAVRLPNTAASFNSFVNDAIGYKMDSEVLLYYSLNCYGTADVISFNDGVLRIHDLKTGTANIASMNQLLIYAALFVLDYGVSTRELTGVELRIYQNSEVTEFFPSPKDVFDVVAVIVRSDKIISKIDEKTVL
jgi:hypothetical protein